MYETGHHMYDNGHYMYKNRRLFTHMFDMYLHMPTTNFGLANCLSCIIACVKPLAIMLCTLSVITLIT